MYKCFYRFGALLCLKLQSCRCFVVYGKKKKSYNYKYNTRQFQPHAACRVCETRSTLVYFNWLLTNVLTAIHQQMEMQACEVLQGRSATFPVLRQTRCSDLLPFICRSSRGRPSFLLPCLTAARDSVSCPRERFSRKQCF